MRAPSQSQTNLEKSSSDWLDQAITVVRCELPHAEASVQGESSGHAHASFRIIPHILNGAGSHSICDSASLRVLLDETAKHVVRGVGVCRSI